MYRGREGQWAFFLHRISGVALALYLLLHVFDISLVMFGPDGPFNAFLFFYHQWPFRIGLVLIIAGVGGIVAMIVREGRRNRAAGSNP